MNGRLVNYVRGLNVDENGGPIIDGFLNDDSGEGLYLPVLEENGRDTLFVTEKERQRFVKTIEISHQLYNVRRSLQQRSGPQWVSQVLLVNKRMNAKMLREKGLGDKSRMYEVQGVSHFAGGGMSCSTQLSRRSMRPSMSPDRSRRTTSLSFPREIPLEAKSLAESYPPAW